LKTDHASGSRGSGAPRVAYGSDGLPPVEAGARYESFVKPVRAQPAILVTVRGGGYSPGTPREGWDHATPWMRRILADLWQLDLRLVEAELTLADVNPAMAHLRELAAELRDRAHAEARKLGQDLAAYRADLRLAASD
jgi:FMN-dependent NADH-azoreductase